MNHSPLLTDLYQLTMAAAYWKCGRAEDEAVFHLFFRRTPFGGSYAIAAGLGDAVEWLRHYRFSAEDLAYLGTMQGRDGSPLFESAFLDYLGDLRLTVDIDAMPEGTLAFAHEPLLRVRGPLVQGQLLETALLCILNYQTLVATKAARVCQRRMANPCWSSACDVPRARTGRCPPAGLRSSGAVRPRRTFSPGNASVFPCAARMRIRGS